MLSVYKWSALFCFIIRIHEAASRQQCEYYQGSYDYDNNDDDYYDKLNGPSHLIGSEDQMSCVEWCREKDAIKWEVLNSTAGLVKLNIAVSPRNCRHDSFTVSLCHDETSGCNLTIDNINDDIRQKVFDLEVISNGSFPKELVWEIDFISTGCYLLAIHPWRNGTTQPTCYSTSFEMSTNYEDIFLADKNVLIAPNYRDEREQLEMTVRFDNYVISGTLPALTYVLLNSDANMDQNDCSDTGDNNACCIVENDLISETTFEEENVNPCGSAQNEDQNKCRCNWHSDAIMCSFEQVLPGNYCVTLNIHDTKCAPPSSKSPYFCRWFHSLEIYSSKTSPNIMATVHHQYTIVYCIASLLAMLLVMVLLFMLVKCKLKGFGRKQMSFTLTPEEPRLESKKLKFFLIYPRDCPLFMDTMAELRIVLKTFLNAEIYDIWDSGMWDNIAEEGATWGLRYIYDPEVKIILVASQCSRFIHDALLNGKEIQYAEPDVFDSAFPVTLRSILNLSVTHPYQRIYVIRLDGEDCEDNVFKYISPFTIYTIPQHLNILILALSNLDSSETALCMDKPLYVQSLSVLVERLNKYKVDNPYYFKNMINIKES